MEQRIENSLVSESSRTGWLSVAGAFHIVLKGWCGQWLTFNINPARYVDHTMIVICLMATMAWSFIPCYYHNHGFCLDRGILFLLFQPGMLNDVLILEFHKTPVCKFWKLQVKPHKCEFNFPSIIRLFWRGAFCCLFQILRFLSLSLHCKFFKTRSNVAAERLNLLIKLSTTIDQFYDSLFQSLWLSCVQKIDFGGLMNFWVIQNLSSFNLQRVRDFSVCWDQIIN